MSPPQEAEPSEQTPLLGGSQDAPPPETPLPKLQIFLLSLSRVAEPLGFAILFPFVNSMVLDTGEISAGEVGYYVGWIESLFSLVQMVFCDYTSSALFDMSSEYFPSSDTMGLGRRQIRPQARAHYLPSRRIRLHDPFRFFHQDMAHGPLSLSRRYIRRKCCRCPNGQHLPSAPATLCMSLTYTRY